MKALRPNSKSKLFSELKPALPPIPASLKRERLLHLLLVLTGPFVRALLKKFVTQVEVVGIEHLQTKRPALVLMNHSNPFDPILLTYYGRFVPHFLITEPYMFERPISKMALFLGQITKRKLDPDTRAIRAMKSWTDLGAKVAMFPEGQFPWDGYPLPMQRGLRELVNFLGVDLITVRLLNGDHLWPGWAKKPRQTKLKIEVDAPIRFDSSPDIEDLVSKRLHVNPESCIRFPVQSMGELALGLAQFLRFCPGCGADRSLSDRGDVLFCSACQEEFQVTLQNSLKNKNHEEKVASIWSRIRSRLTERWSEEGLMLQGVGEAEVFDASRTQWKTLSRGDAVIENSILRIGSFHLDLNEMVAHTMDWGDLILIRTLRYRFAIRLPNDSRAVWTEALDFFLARKTS